MVNKIEKKRKNSTLLEKEIYKPHSVGKITNKKIFPYY